MCHQPLASVSMLAVVLALVWVMPVSLVGQTASPLRTAWGDPDLQGTFTNKTITPFERPTALAGKGVPDGRRGRRTRANPSGGGRRP